MGQQGSVTTYNTTTHGNKREKIKSRERSTWEAHVGLLREREREHVTWKRQ